jgi:hypothetical protein
MIRVKPIQASKEMDSGSIIQRRRRTHKVFAQQGIARAVSPEPPVSTLRFVNRRLKKTRVCESQDLDTLWIYVREV